MASHLVLLGTPRELHIPYFAMAVPRSRESYVERLSIEGDLVGLVGQRCASWIKYRQENVELIATRNYLFPRTAIYTKWLLFKDETTAAEFLNSYPNYRLEHRLKTIGSEASGFGHQASGAPKACSHLSPSVLGARTHR